MNRLVCGREKIAQALLRKNVSVDRKGNWYAGSCHVVRTVMSPQNERTESIEISQIKITLRMRRTDEDRIRDLAE